MNNDETYTPCTQCGRPMSYCKGQCCGKTKGCQCKEYGPKVCGAIRPGEPKCPYQAVIPTLTVESVSNLKDLADCFVHVSDINTTFYIDDKHRVVITWAGPVDIPGYDMEGNPNNYRDQIVTDTEAKAAVIYDRSGKGYVFGLAENLDVQEEVNNKLDEMAESGELEELLLHYFRTDKSHVPLTNNVLAGANWTLGSGWSGNASDGFTHTGGTETLTTTISINTGSRYVVRFTCTNQTASTTEQSLVVQFGGSPVYEQYQNDGTVTKYFTFYPENGILTFTPANGWVGNVLNIGVYEVTNANKLDQSLIVYDENDEAGYAITVTDKDMGNIVVGKDSLRFATEGCKYNVAIGDNVLEGTATGYFNTAIGYKSQQNSIGGTRNVSVGYNSLNRISFGDRNIAIGSFALEKVSTGRNNIGIGADSAWNTTTGSNNIAISNGALNANTTGSNNIALGYFTNSANTTGTQNISLGHTANSYNTTGLQNIAIGSQAHYKGTNDKFNVAIGSGVMTDRASVSGDVQYSVAIGYQALKKNGGDANVAIGREVLNNISSNTGYNIALGYNTLSNITTTSAEGDNIAIGHSSGRAITGSNNIALGRGALNGACVDKNIAIGNEALKLTTGSNNIAIGYRAGEYVTNHSNTINIGYNTHGYDRDNSINIGNIFRHNGETGTTAIGDGIDPVAGARVYLRGGGTSLAPLKIGSGTLKTTTEVGAIEFDGSHLYFTDSSGTRHQLAVVA